MIWKERNGRSCDGVDIPFKNINDKWLKTFKFEGSNFRFALSVDLFNSILMGRGRGGIY